MFPWSGDTGQTGLLTPEHLERRVPPHLADTAKLEDMTELSANQDQPRQVLLVEDSMALSVLYQQYLKQAGYGVTAVMSGEDALGALKEEPAAVALDLGLPDMDGLTILKLVQSLETPVPVVVITSNASLGSAVEAMRLGAFDYLVKPITAERLATTLRNALEFGALKRKVAAYQEQSTRDSFAGFIGSSPQMRAIYEVIGKAARSQASVFVTGESGTGKEVCAKAIHASSARSQKPFVAINCAAIPRDIMESEIFGHVKGAFTGATADRAGAAELADGGTLFLDEICEMDIDLQAKLLRLLESGTYQRVGSGTVMKADLRIVCATNRDPRAEIAARRFREDLFYRLHVIPIHLPPLRERGDDCRLISERFLARFAKAEGKRFTSFAIDAVQAIARHTWPGNVRELQNAIHNAVVLNDDEVLTAAMLPPLTGAEPPPRMPAESAAASAPSPAAEPRPAGGPLDIVPLWQVEKQAILAAIEACGGNVPKAAAFLEIGVSTIYRKKAEWDAVQAAAHAK
jgi:two-component system repressor protein LuxO